MMSFPRLLALGAVVLAAVVIPGCQSYDKPNKPLPETFRAVGLDGTTITRDSLKGKPWVINIWLPG